ncbi:MAG: amino acid-binding protein [Desulfovibrionaceae bacterium]|nr:amino acid-binding protein [Desulfovibrionaceae bacterium]
MQKCTVSFLGRDCPGVVSTVSGLLCAAGCNITAATQSLLLGEFAGIFLVEIEDQRTPEALQQTLLDGLRGANMDLSLIVRPTCEGAWGQNVHSEPFVVSADGDDGNGQIAKMSKVFSRHGVNIESLRAFLGEGSVRRALFVFEVMVPETVDIGRLRRELVCEGQSLGLRVSVQHRDIFEAVNRIGSI